MSKTIILFFSILNILVLSCTANDPISNLKTEDTRVFISNYDKNIDFSSFKTYYISDTFFVNISGSIRKSTKGSDSTFKKIFTENFKKANFKYVNKTNNPDLGITITRVTNTKIGLNSPGNIYFNNYWGVAKFGEDGFEYPGYYTFYEIGDPIWNIEMVDLKNVDKNQKLKIVWNAQIIGENIFEELNFGYLIDKIFDISTFFNQKQ